VSGCSVIVCTRHRTDALERCLASLAQIDEPECELIVVDNTQGDTETERISTNAGARYIVAEGLGLSGARNAGIDSATGDLLAFVDDDAVVDPAWLLRHSEVLADDSLTAATGRVLPLASEDDGGWNGVPAVDLGPQAFVVDRGDQWWFERANFGGLVSGTNMVLKRRAFERGARFSETLGSGAGLQGFEEYNFFFHMIRDGARVAYVPSALVRHGPDFAAREPARARRLSAAYLTKLLVEEPEFRGRTLRYIGTVLRRERFPWRYGPGPSRLRVLTDGLLGQVEYLRGRLTRRWARRPSALKQRGRTP
jgi:cellulose synthase/poly-beta-1,6-N-acetylglucosamine synthase-like glycosyltransferase